METIFPGMIIVHRSARSIFSPGDHRRSAASSALRRSSS